MFTAMKDLEQGLAHIKQSPRERGTVDLIVCRPEIGTRKVLHTGQLDLEQGLIGDNWLSRGNRKTSDGTAHPDMQLNLMNARAIDLIARSKDRWQLAGDQFFVDLDLSPNNLPPGTPLKIGSAIIEVTALPHLGCKKFVDRFGRDAAIFVNSGAGKALNLRGINAKVIEPGQVEVGCAISKCS